jgi:hypothetical protein
VKGERSVDGGANTENEAKRKRQGNKYKEEERLRQREIQS